jgi:hypothetical protein
MSNELNILLSTGKTITADVINGSTVAAANVSLTERSSTGHYFGNITGLAAGNYFVVFKEGSNAVGYGELYWDGTKEIINKLDVDLSTRATQTSVNAIPTNPLLTNDSRLNNLSNIDLIRKLITNSSKIDELTNKLIVYDDDETTPILEFTTKNSAGVNSTSEIFEIRKI